MGGPDVGRSSIRLVDDRPPSGSPAPVVAVDAGIDRERHADELVAVLCAAAVRAGASGVVGATHWAGGDGRRRIALTLSGAGVTRPALLRAVEEAVGSRAGTDVLVDVLGGDQQGPRTVLGDVLRAHRSRSSGRVVVAPGLAEAPDIVTAGLLVRDTAIDRVVQLAAGDADPEDVVRTRRHLRPRWERGALVLHVQPARGGTLVPFEVPDPTPCCAAHA